jgi:hypothetical protein
MCASAEREALVDHLALPRRRKRSDRDKGNGAAASGRGVVRQALGGCTRGARLLRELTEPAQGLSPFERGAPHRPVGLS